MRKVSMRGFAAAAAAALALGACEVDAASTQLFANSTAITIADNTTATPFPSIINVSGIVPATATRVRVQLNGLTHAFESDLDILLVGPQGQRSILVSDASLGSSLSNVTVTFAADAAAAVPALGPLLTATSYRPANYVGSTPDDFPFVSSTSLDHAPADLTTFDLQDPNGVWSLYVVDDAAGQTGSISGGWTLAFDVPAVFTVNSTADPGDGTCDVTECTLREAIAAAGNHDLVKFSALFDGVQTITLAAGEILVNKSVTVQGRGADILTISGNDASRVFRVQAGATLSLDSLALRDGLAADVGGAVVSDGNLFLHGVEVSNSTAGAGFAGGGLYIAGGYGAVVASSIHDNRATGGAGIEVINAGALIDDSTIAFNVADTEGGGVRLQSISGGSAEVLEVRHSTIANNRSPTGGGLVVHADASVAATATLRNTLVADNTGASFATVNAFANITSQGYNLASDGGGGLLDATGDKTNVDPRLGPLSPNGGTTPSLALLGGSPALDAGHSSGGRLDQRGIFRLYDIPGIAAAAGGDGADIGAVEMRARIVTNANDSGGGSLREAISTADIDSGLDDVLFDDTAFGVAQSIDLATALPDITGDLAVHGPGANLLTVRRSPAAAGHFRVFHVPGAATRAAFSGLTIANGLLDSGNAVNDVGGGIRSAGPLALSAVHVTGNHAAVGGGVAVVFTSGVFDRCTFSANFGQVEGGGFLFQDSGPHALRLSNSTISGNSVGPTGFGGGIEVIGESGRALLQITSSTITGNAGDNGGGLDVSSFGASGAGRATLTNSIVAGNTPTNFNAVADVGGGTASITSAGYNLSDHYDVAVIPSLSDLLAAPALRPLAMNGGPVPTHLPQWNSPALDQGFSQFASHDQRGDAFPRPVDIPGVNDADVPGDRADIGAVELQFQEFDQVFVDGFDG